MPKDYVRLTISIPRLLKEKLEVLAEFPYDNVSNAAKVLIQESLDRREGKSCPRVNEYIEFLSELDDVGELLEIANTALRRIAHKTSEATLPESDQLKAWAFTQLSEQSGISLERLQSIQQGGKVTAKELETLARVLETTPEEVKKTLKTSFSEPGS
ncbi:MAG: hypothetical protein F6J86_20775 [Symploca sp. SIO1B1]|nr:hypothetical protein [Symploca sp. SIO1B1]